MRLPAPSGSSIPFRSSRRPPGWANFSRSCLPDFEWPPVHGVWAMNGKIFPSCAGCRTSKWLAIQVQCARQMRKVPVYTLVSVLTWSILGCVARVANAEPTLGHSHRILRTQARHFSAR
jgi:hypothetical protein